MLPIPLSKDIVGPVSDMALEAFAELTSEKDDYYEAIKHSIIAYTVMN